MAKDAKDGKRWQRMPRMVKDGKGWQRMAKDGEG